MDITIENILDMYDHLSTGEKSKTLPEICADHGLKEITLRRALTSMIPPGDGRLDAAKTGLVIGLQLGSMRLDPIKFDPEDLPQCNCILCVIERTLVDGGDTD
jgi:hypothetical protein